MPPPEPRTDKVKNLRNTGSSAHRYFYYVEMFYNRKRGIVRIIRCYRQNMKINIINYSEVSKLDMALHFSIIQYGDLYYLTTIQSNFLFQN